MEPIRFLSTLGPALQWGGAQSVILFYLRKHGTDLEANLWGVVGCHIRTTIGQSARQHDTDQIPINLLLSRWRLKRSREAQGKLACRWISRQVRAPQFVNDRFVKAQRRLLVLLL